MFPNAIYKVSVVAALVLGAGLAGTAFGARPDAAAKQPQGRKYPIRAADLNLPPVVPGEMIVRVAPGVDGAAVAQSYGLSVKSKLKDTPNTYVFEGIQGDLQRAALVLNGTPGVVRASLNGVCYAHALPRVAASDPLQGQQWALRVQNATPFWSISVGERLAGGAVGADDDPTDGDDDTVVVAVLDEAVQTSHPDLEDSIALDSTGATGFDAVLDQPYDENDIIFGFGFNNHGTNVSGCVAGTTNNGIGIASLSWEAVKVLPVRVLGNFGSGNSADLLEGINYAIQQDVDVINMSLGFSPFFFSQIIADAIIAAHAQGIAIVVSTGNSRQAGTSPGVSFPAYLDECIAVGAVGPNGELASYSDGGAEIDLVAPGGNQGGFSGTTSGVLTTDSQPFNFGNAPLGYDYVQGTSFSAPYVSGAVASLMTQGARDPSLSGSEQVERIRQLLQRTARSPFGRFTNDFGFGIIDVGAALAEFTQRADVLSPTPNEVTASFAEPVSIFLTQNELVPNPAGPAGDYTRVPIAFTPDVDPDDGVVDGVALYHTYRNVRRGTGAELDANGQFLTFEPGSDDRFGIGNNDLDLQLPNGVDPDELLVRSLTGPEVLWVEARTGNTRRIPARSFRFRVTPRVELPSVRMMSVPHELQDGADTVRFLYGSNLVRLARWLPDENRYAYWDLENPGQQEPEAELTTDSAGVARPPLGVGFFARIVSETQVQLLGRSERAGAYRIPLQPGFNMIGNPYPFRVPWNVVNVQFRNEVLTLDEAFRRGLIRNTLWRFLDGRYVFQALPNGSLEPWEAHWVRALSSDLTLIVPRVASVIGSTASAPRPAAPLEGWKRSIRVAAAGKLAGEVFVGQGRAARDGFGPEDVETPPALLPVADLRIRNRNWGAASGAYVQDIRRQRRALQQWTLEVETSRAGTPVKLSWDRFPAGMAAQLRVEGTAQTADLTRPGSLEFKSTGPGVRKLSLVAAGLPGA